MCKATKVPDLIRMRQDGEKILALTAYDYSFARIVDQAGIHIILVGDSLGTVIQGHETTLPVTLEEVIYHTRCVHRAATKALVVADMPFLSYQTSISDAVEAAGRLLKEGGAEAVKIEGGEAVSPTVQRLTEIGIPVMGHLGLTPQSVHAMGGHRVQAREPEAAKRLIEDAKALERAGAFSLVLEGIPADLAAEVRTKLRIPTIGIGAGPHCDGQILVLYDMLGLTDFKEGKQPKFLKQYASFFAEAQKAIETYAAEVRTGEFPAAEHCYHGAGPRLLSSRTEKCSGG